MKTTQEIFVQVINTTSNYHAVSQAMTAALDVLMNENEEINTSYIDCYLYDEDQKRGLVSSETLRSRRARHIIKKYIREIVIASIKEEIMKNGDFSIPENGKNDGLFDEGIISRYEIEDCGSGKGEWDDYASFDVMLKGSLKDVFERYSCSNIEFCVIFDASHFSDTFEITDISDVEDSIQKIEMHRDYDIQVDALEGLANYLVSNPNKQLLFHEIRCPRITK